MTDKNQNMADEIIADVEQLFEAKANVYAQLAAARTMLRGLDTLGKLTAEQSAYVTEAFPLKQRGVRRSEAVAA
jgi:hypothetical protein